MTACRFENQVAVVTGGGGGLGRAYAVELASRGANVVVNDSGSTTEGDGSDNTPADAVAAEITAAGGVALADHHNVARSEEAEAVIATAERAFGGVHIIVHNAGIVRRADFPEMIGPTLTNVLDVNLLSAFHIVRAAWTRLVGQGFGRIVLTSSGGGLFGSVRSGNYAAAKLGIIGLAQSLAAEGEAHGVTTNVIVPIAKTRLATTLPIDVIGRLDPNQVAPVVGWLVHRDCTVNGEVFSAAGGRVNRICIAVNEGFLDDQLSIEAVRDAFDRIRDMTGAIVVENSAQALALRLPPVGASHE
jgi:NAD(P)-dependent dehydrogenase (short-subunit alcohol dehydrogenase family)